MERSRPAVGLALLALTLTPASASASDSSATEAYLRANYALVKVGHAHLGASIAGYKGILTMVKRSCPRAAAGSPQDPESTELSNEVIGTMVLTAGKPDRPAIKTYLNAVAGLRWSSSKVTRAVSRYAASLRKLYDLSVPDLCGDVKAWAAGGFKSTPASTVSFVKVFYPNWVALGLIPPGISRFESSGARSLARAAERFEYQITNVEAQAVETWGDIMDELLLNP
ncbi:MAG TPA: hypothetical protein VN618_04685 [Solirubrobacteraceae bacterium]|nr:hypothetical protein [Solirubrobacteraceae bacterium]